MPCSNLIWASSSEVLAEHLFKPCVFGPRLIIDSVGDGKRIAVAVDEYLTGRKRPDPEIVVEVLDHHRIFAVYMNLSRQPVPMLPLERRTGVTEVEIGFDEQSGMAEARRCLRCWINTVFEGDEADGSQCILCGGCADVCPEECLRLVPLEQIEFPPEILDGIRQNEQLYSLMDKAGPAKVQKSTFSDDH